MINNGQVIIVHSDVIFEELFKHYPTIHICINHMFKHHIIISHYHRHWLENSVLHLVQHFRPYWLVVPCAMRGQCCVHGFHAIYFGGAVLELPIHPRCDH